MTNAVDAINRLRAIATRLLEREDPAAAWFAAALQEYESGARHGMTLEQAFELAPAHGERAWWQIEAVHQRDELLRAVRKAHFPQLGDRPAAAAIAQAIARYEAGRWRQERKDMKPPEGLRGDLFKLLKLDVPLSESTIRRAIAVGSPEAPSAEPSAA